MSSYRFPDKDPDAVLWYTSDWTAWLVANGTTLASCVWELPPELDLVQSVNDDMTAQVLIGGGIEGEVHEFTARITTADGQTDDRTYSIRVRQR